MNLDDALNAKKQEIESLQTDINNLEEQALGLKDSVLKYNELKSKSHKLKTIKKKKESEFKAVTTFFNSVDENYLMTFFPLFANEIKALNQPGEKEETKEEKEAAA